MAVLYKFSGFRRGGFVQVFRVFRPINYGFFGLIFCFEVDDALVGGAAEEQVGVAKGLDEGAFDYGFDVGQGSEKHR